MTDVPGAGLIGLLAGLALNALGRWSERPCPEPTEPVGEFDPWMFTSDQRRHSRYARESSKILQGLVATGSDVPIVEPERRKLAWRRSKLEQPKAPASGLTLSQAAERYLAAKARKRSVTNDRRILEHFKTEFGKDTALVEITGSRISEYRAQRLTATRGQGARPLSAAAVNRPLALLRHLLRLACDEWEVLLTAPKIRLEKEPQGRLPVVDTRGRGQAARGVPGAEERRLADLAELALYTGMRRGEMLGLTWDRVDRARGVVLLERTKSGRRREVPLNAPADAILARRAPDTLRDGFVFGTHSWYTFRGHWKAAVKAAGLEDFRFHDLRHTFASWAVQRGATLPELKDLLGHSSLAMVMRYAHLSPEHLRSAVARLDMVLTPPKITQEITHEPSVETSKGSR